jgi:hypothetical protein
MTGYTTAALIEAELRATTALSATSSPTLMTVTTWINQESGYVDSISGTKYASTQYTEYFDYNNEDRIQLRNSPLISIDKFEYNSASLGSTPTWSEMTEDTAFISYPKYSEVLLVPGVFSPKDGYRNIRIQYTAGYASTDIPEPIKLLTTKLVANRILSSLINSNVNEGNDGGSISVGSISIVEPASYGVNSYKQLKTDIKDLEEKLITGTVILRY